MQERETENEVEVEQRLEPIIIRMKRTMAPFAILPFPKYDKFFQCQSIDDRGNLLVRCLMCCQKTKLLSCSASSSSNLRKHVKSQHPERLQEIDSSAKLDVRKRSIGGTTSNHASRLTASSVSQLNVDQLIMNYVINDLRPISLCDKTSFRELVAGLQPQKTIMSSEAFVARMEMEYETMKSQLIQVLSRVATVSTTADCWSSAKGSTLGMTVHWINPLTLDRCSAALACRRLKATPSYDVLAEAMDEISREYKIHDKVCSITTDNGSNFCKAFGLFADAEDDDADDDCDGSDVKWIVIEEILDEGSQSGRFYSLPRHIRCASHTLSLVATKDVHEALKDETFKWICESTFTKCNSLWNMQALSNCVADNITESLGIHLMFPNLTRWNSMYDAMKQICDLCQMPDKMDSYCAILGLSPFQRNELTFIREYCEIMQPMTTALNILQSEKKMFIGYLLPTIHTLEKNLLQRAMRPMNFCLPLLNAIKTGVRNRFDSIWWDQKLVMASCLLPKFKFDWLHDDEFISLEVRKWLLTEIGSSLSANASTLNTEDDDASFFHFTKTEVKSENNSAEMQLQTYVQTHRKDNCMFLESPLFKSLFIKYNTSLTSSASVEPLFSIAGEVFNKKRLRLASVSDPHFEKQFLLKVNGSKFKK